MKAIEQIIALVTALEKPGILGLYGLTVFLIYKLTNKFLTALVAAVRENSEALGKLSSLVETFLRPEEKKK